MKELFLLKKACINLLVNEMLDTDDKDGYIASLLINGTGDGPLKNKGLVDLLDMVYDQLNYSMSEEESEKFSSNLEDSEFHEWIMSRSKKVKNWYKLVG